MTTIPSRACAPLISAIQEATTTAVAVIQLVREIPAAIPLVQTAEITPDLRRMEAPRLVLTAAPAAATIMITAAPDHRSSFKFVAM
jgi:hypothetical protein